MAVFPTLKLVLILLFEVSCRAFLLNTATFKYPWLPIMQGKNCLNSRFLFSSTGLAVAKGVDVHGLRCSAPDTMIYQNRFDQIAATKDVAFRNAEFSSSELDNIVLSLKSLAQPDNSIDWPGVRTFLSQSAHLSHKDWAKTQENAGKLSDLIQGPEDPVFRSIFARVLEDGNWDGASAAASTRPPSFDPWVVLVTGVNGIRKTSSVYQPWFKTALAEALGDAHPGAADELPDGRDR